MLNLELIGGAQHQSVVVVERIEEVWSAGTGNGISYGFRLITVADELGPFQHEAPVIADQVGEPGQEHPTPIGGVPDEGKRGIVLVVDKI